MPPAVEGSTFSQHCQHTRHMLKAKAYHTIRNEKEISKNSSFFVVHNNNCFISFLVSAWIIFIGHKFVEHLNIIFFFVCHLPYPYGGSSSLTCSFFCPLSRCYPVLQYGLIIFTTESWIHTLDNVGRSYTCDILSISTYFQSTVVLLQPNVRKIMPHVLFGLM